MANRFAAQIARKTMNKFTIGHVLKTKASQKLIEWELSASGRTSRRPKQ